MNKIIINDLNFYINEHFKYQIISLKLSDDANQKGFPGFAYFFQVEAADAFVHIRKICNYLMDHNAKIEIQEIKTNNIITKNIEETLKILKFIKIDLLNLTNKLSENSNKQNDYLTQKFYDWFLIDFYQEIAYEDKILNWLKMSNYNFYKIDKKLLKTKEPNILKVINPFFKIN